MRSSRHNRTCIATVCLSGTLEDKLDAAAAAGFDGVEIFENDLIASPWSPREIRRRCAELGLAIDLYQPFRDFEGAPAEVLERNLRRAGRKFDLMEELGTDTLLVCSTVSPDAAGDDGLAAEHLRTLADRAAGRGLRIAYEALAWGRFVNTWEHSWQLVRRVDHPALGLCLDSFHILSKDPDPAGIAAIPGEKIFFLQLADAPRLRMDLLRWSRHHRLFPGQGAFDLPAFVRQVRATGYDGPLSLEVFNDVFRQADPRRAGVDAMRSLLALQEDLDEPAHRSAPELTAHAFTELAVDRISGPRITATLTALGFASAGRHRTRPVELWQQGTARVLLDTSDTGTRDMAEVTALGFGSADPARSARHARALLAAPARDPHAVRAPDGTSIVFCPAFDGPEGFAPVSPSLEGGWLTHTDHLTLAQPFDQFDEAVLFYRSALGLPPDQESEFAAPFGLIHSRAAHNPSSRIRVALNSTLLRRGEWSPAVPEPQHIAFATSGIFTAVRAMRERGARLLPVPDNYYADLDSRLALGPGLLDALRENNVLYDRFGQGEFFHFYTELQGSRVFFEVVERRGGYAGYGAANTPVRMAAHRRLRQAHDAAPPHPGR